MRVAVLGTGTMGTGIAHSLVRAGIDVTAWNRHIERAEPLAADGVRVETDVTVAVADADVVLTMLFDETAVTEVAGEMLGSVAKGAIWMQCATVGPSGIRRLAALAQAKGVSIVDSPVVGTKQPAEEGKLVLPISGDPALIDRLAPVLDAIGSKTVNAGPEIGAASAVKLACNSWVAALTAGAAQAISLSRALGVDPTLFMQAIAGGASDSPYLQLKGGLMLSGDFAPSFAVDGLLKDLNLMIAELEPLGASTRLVAPLRDTFEDSGETGHGGDDVAAVISAF